jgi:hypothetical protein
MYKLYSSIEYNEPENMHGCSLNFFTDFDEKSISIPILDATGYINFSKGFRLIGEVQDLFIAFQGENGRKVFTPYLQEGFKAGIQFQFTL